MADKISVVIPHVSVDKTFDDMLNGCIESLSGYDELIVVLNDAIGYGKSFNKGFRFAKGDYICAVSNDTILLEGSLKDLCDPQAVTFSANSQFGCFFCMPRWVYEKIGGFDETYGLAYYEDNDFLLRLEDAKIPLKRISSVKVFHAGGLTVKALGKESEASQIGKQRHLEKWGDRDAIIPELRV